jgi:CBS domain-containing protein
VTQTLATEIETMSAELAVKSFQAFCDDIGGMFEIQVTCVHEWTRRCNAGELKSQLGKLITANQVRANGALSGAFNLVFDRKALFTLSGVIVMLPEERIVKLCRTGEAKDATDMADAMKEAGNLLVGSWDKVFREEMPGHAHFLREDVFIGDPWANPEKSLGLKDGEDMLCVTCSVTVAPYASFKCFALFPGSIFEKPQEAAKEPDKITETAGAEAIQPQPASEGGPLAAEVAAVSPRSDIAGIEQVLARDIMCSDIVWVDAESTVGSVFEKMESNGASYALAGTDGHAAGVISRCDLAGAISPYLKPTFSRWRRPQDDATLDIKVKWVMGKPVRMVKMSTPVNVAAAQMLQWRIGCLPVADDTGKIHGILTRNEILKMLLRNS